MKRYLYLSIVLIVAVSMVACNPNQDTIQAPVNFYYCNESMTFNSNDAVLLPEVRECAAYSGNVTDILEVYLKGPISPGYRSPFPQGTAIVSIDNADNTICVQLTKEFSTLKGLQLTLACASLAKTTIELTECEFVEISAADATLDGKTAVILSQDSLLLLDMSITE